jgi:hypothetical protein
MIRCFPKVWQSGVFKVLGEMRFLERFTWDMFMGEKDYLKGYTGALSSMWHLHLYVCVCVQLRA